LAFFATLAAKAAFKEKTKISEPFLHIEVLDRSRWWSRQQISEPQVGDDPQTVPALNTDRVVPKPQ
jgi:hypothetical protein